MSLQRIRLRRGLPLLLLALSGCTGVTPAATGAPPAGSPALALAGAVGELFNGQLVQAESDLRERLGARPGDGEARAYLALLLLYDGRLAPGLTEAERAAGDSPGGFTLSVLARARDWNGKIPDAVQAGERSVSLDQSVALSHAFLGEALADAHRFDDAMRELKSAETLAGAPSTTDFVRAEVDRDWANYYADRGDAADRGDRLRKAETEDPQFYPRTLELAHYYYDVGDDASARQVLERAAAGAAASPELLYEAGVAAIFGFDYTAVRDIFARLVQQQPHNSAALSLLAHATYNLTRDPGATESLLFRALGEDSGNVDAYGYLLHLARLSGDQAALSRLPTLSQSSDHPPGASAVDTGASYRAFLDDQRQRAIARANQARVTAGLPPLTELSALDQSTEAHAFYYLFNSADASTRDLGIHLEEARLPGFTGAQVYEREQHFGYAPARAGEDITHAGNPEQSISDWVDSVYHRFPIMAPETVTVGYTAAAIADLPIEVMDFGMGPSVRGSDQVVVYPADGQTGVSRCFTGNELPDPTPEATRDHLYPVGYPVTATFPASAAVTISSGGLSDKTGAEVPSWQLAPGTGYMGSNWALLARAELAAGATYTVHLAGSIDGRAFTRQWSFTTAGSATC
ncbi:MAG: hypothetical protein ACYDAY_02490 [Candidatus Dormibacteria bacterium]